VFQHLKADPNDKPSLKKKFKEAGEMIKAALTDPTHPLHKLVTINAKAVEPFEDMKNENERAMTKLAQSLPIWTDWGMAIRGFGAFGLAQIIAESGDLSNYTTVSKLWKRLGLAVMDGKRQGRPGEGASKETWIAHGYNAERRSIMWNIGKFLLMAQAANVDKETGVVVREAEHYRAIYDARKVYERPRVQSDGHAHNRAQRYVEKMFFADLWAAWRQTMGYVKSDGELSAAEVCDGGEATLLVQSTTCLPPAITSKSKPGVKVAGRRRLKEAA
jgi:hypothetical protein